MYVVFNCLYVYVKSFLPYPPQKGQASYYWQNKNKTKKGGNISRFQLKLIEHI